MSITTTNVFWPSKEKSVFTASMKLGDDSTGQDIQINLSVLPPAIATSVIANGQPLDYEPGDVTGVSFDIPPEYVDALLRCMRNFTEAIELRFGRVSDRVRMRQMVDLLMESNPSVLATLPRFERHMKTLTDGRLAPVLEYLRDLDSYLEDSTAVTVEASPPPPPVVKEEKEPEAPKPPALENDVIDADVVG